MGQRFLVMGRRSTRSGGLVREAVDVCVQAPDPDRRCSVAGWRSRRSTPFGCRSSHRREQRIVRHGGVRPKRHGRHGRSVVGGGTHDDGTRPSSPEAHRQSGQPDRTDDAEDGDGEHAIAGRETARRRVDVRLSGRLGWRESAEPRGGGRNRGRGWLSGSARRRRGSCRGRLRGPRGHDRWRLRRGLLGRSRRRPGRGLRGRSRRGPWGRLGLALGRRRLVRLGGVSDPDAEIGFRADTGDGRDAEKARRKDEAHGARAPGSADHPSVPVRAISGLNAGAAAIWLTKIRTRSGSNCVPAQRSSSASASSCVRACLYGRELTIAS